jgi:hypothetical protein
MSGMARLSVKNPLKTPREETAFYIPGKRNVNPDARADPAESISSVFSFHPETLFQ